MMKMPKLVPHDAWQNRFEGRKTTDEMRDRVPCTPLDESDLTEFCIEICHCPARGEASFTLFGKLNGYTDHPLCRYETQIGRHVNPKWIDPYFIGAGILHRHVYNERALREGWPWDKCAEPLKLTKVPKRKLSLQQAIDQMTPIFLRDLEIEIHDPDVNVLFGR